MGMYDDVAFLARVENPKDDKKVPVGGMESLIRLGEGAQQQPELRERQAGEGRKPSALLPAVKVLPVVASKS